VTGDNELFREFFIEISKAREEVRQRPTTYPDNSVEKSAVSFVALSGPPSIVPPALFHRQSHGPSHFEHRLGFFSEQSVRSASQTDMTRQASGSQEVVIGNAATLTTLRWEAPICWRSFSFPRTSIIEVMPNGSRGGLPLPQRYKEACNHVPAI